MGKKTMVIRRKGDNVMIAKQEEFAATIEDAIEILKNFFKTAKAKSVKPILLSDDGNVYFVKLDKKHVNISLFSLEDTDKADEKILTIRCRPKTEYAEYVYAVQTVMYIILSELGFEYVDPAYIDTMTYIWLQCHDIKPLDIKASVKHYVKANVSIWDKLDRVYEAFVRENIRHRMNILNMIYTHATQIVNTDKIIMSKIIDKFYRYMLAVLLIMDEQEETDIVAKQIGYKLTTNNYIIRYKDIIGVTE